MICELVLVESTKNNSKICIKQPKKVKMDEFAQSKIYKNYDVKAITNLTQYAIMLYVSK